MTEHSERAARIAALNDAFRSTLVGGRVYLTAGVDALTDAAKRDIVARVKAFAAFDDGNDPYGEHDFGAFDAGGEKIFWKIDYYDARDPDLGADNPADPETTERALTIMLASEY